MTVASLSARDIRRNWYLIDAKDKILGRLASEVATILMGKNKAQYVSYLDTGDNVVIINAKDIKVSGKKETQKIYNRNSGYPGGYREETLAKLRERKPEDILRQAIKGMLPKSKLGRELIKKLHVFAGSEHPFGDKMKKDEKDGK